MQLTFEVFVAVKHICEVYIKDRGSKTRPFPCGFLEDLLLLCLSSQHFNILVLLLDNLIPRKHNEILIIQ